jgi:hypothetical protein
VVDRLLLNAAPFIVCLYDLPDRAQRARTGRSSYRRGYAENLDLYSVLAKSRAVLSTLRAVTASARFDLPLRGEVWTCNQQLRLCRQVPQSASRSKWLRTP